MAQEYEFVRDTGQGKIYREVCSPQKAVQNLRELYDVCNRIARRLESEGFDTSPFFYNSPEEIAAAEAAGVIKPIDEKYLM